MNNSDLHSVTQTLLPVLRGMCYQPEALIVRETTDPDGHYDKIIVIEPHVMDGGILNGAASRQWNAIRRVFWLGFNRYGMNVKAVLRENPEGVREKGPNFRANPNFEKDTNFTHLLAQVMSLTLNGKYVCRREPIVNDAKGRPCLIIRVSGAEPADVAAIADVFWPFGYRNGLIISIRTQKLNDHHHSPLQRTSSLPG